MLRVSFDTNDEASYHPPARSMLVAFCGTRGVPANYGGFETAVDEISRRFAARGIACEVFCRASDASELPTEHDGRRLAYVRGSRRRSLDTFVSSFQTGWKLWRDRKQYTHVFWFNNANLPGILMTRLASIPMSLNTDGLEWRRAKWRGPFKAYYFIASALLTRVCRTLISDSHGIQRYYAQRFGAQTTFIPYGVPPSMAASTDREAKILAEWGVERGKYFLQVTRVEPDNLPLEIARAFVQSGLAARGIQLLSIGYKDPTPYAAQLKALDGNNGVRVSPGVYDPEVLHVLRKHCLAYLHGNTVGGTNPALLEAMAVCPRVAAIDCEFSREVLGGTGWFFTVAELATLLAALTECPDQSAAMAARVGERYDWDAVAACYADLAAGEPADYEAELLRS